MSISYKHWILEHAFIKSETAENIKNGVAFLSKYTFISSHLYKNCNEKTNTK
jgi:hypothetical protein